MKNIMIRSCTLLAFSVFLVACNKPVAEPEAASDQPAVATTTDGVSDEAPAAVKSVQRGDKGLMTASPGIADCGNGTDVEFTWDTTSRPDLSNVQIWLGEDGPDAVLFASGGATGKQSTGPWVKPGTVFIMRNPVDKQEADRVTIGGEACPAAAP